MAKVLIAEDDALIAATLEMGLSDSGYEVCGVAATIARAVEIAERHQPDLAVIDLNLARGEDGRELAARLNRSRRIGIAFATGDLEPRLLVGAPGEVCLEKPFRIRDIVEALRTVEHILREGAPPARLPPGLHLISRGRAG
jgi:DNA-binding response OmpR family regulator